MSRRSRWCQCAGPWQLVLRRRVAICPISPSPPTPPLAGGEPILNHLPRTCRTCRCFSGLMESVGKNMEEVGACVGVRRAVMAFAATRWGYVQVVRGSLPLRFMTFGSHLA